MSGVTLDAGPLIALDRHDRRVLALLARARSAGQRVTIPACALAQALRQPARQVLLMRLARQPGTDLVSLDGPDATSVGLLLQSSRTDDISDAHVVVCARRTSGTVLTSDPEDIRHLDPALDIVAV